MFFIILVAIFAMPTRKFSNNILTGKCFILRNNNDFHIWKYFLK